MQTINSDQLFALKHRWATPEGVEILKRLFFERIDFSSLVDTMKAAQSRFAISDLRGIDFSNKDLSHDFLLSFSDLSYSDFSGCVIQGSFQESVLIDAKFDAAQFSGGYFSGANLDGASFRDSILKHAIFEDTSLAGVSFSRAKLLHVNFAGSDLTRVDFSNAHFGRVFFGYTKLLKTKALFDLISRSEEVLNREGIIWVEPTEMDN